MYYHIHIFLPFLISLHWLVSAECPSCIKPKHLTKSSAGIYHRPWSRYHNAPGRQRNWFHHQRNSRRTGPTAVLWKIFILFIDTCFMGLFCLLAVLKLVKLRLQFCGSGGFPSHNEITTLLLIFERRVGGIPRFECRRFHSAVVPVPSWWSSSWRTSTSWSHVRLCSGNQAPRIYGTRGLKNLDRIFCFDSGALLWLDGQ